MLFSKYRFERYLLYNFKYHTSNSNKASQVNTLMENHSISSLTHKRIVDELKSDYKKLNQKLNNENSKLRKTTDELVTENRNLKKLNGELLDEKQDGKSKLDRLTKLHDRLSCKK